MRGLPLTFIFMTHENALYSHNEIQFGYGLRLLTVHAGGRHPHFTAYVFDYWMNLGAHT